MHTSPSVRGRWTLRAAASLAVVAVSVVAAGGVALAGDSKWFYYGSDSNYPAAHGSRYPYTEPGTGGVYGGYVGELGTWTDWQGCTSGIALNPTALAEANADERTPKTSAANKIPGVFFYWFAAGPGADPHYDGTTTEAYHWGVLQAERANADYWHTKGVQTETTYTPLLFMDIENQPVAGYANGWDEVVNRCGQITRDVTIPPGLDRSTFDGFADYLHYRTIFHPGVYSTPQYWTYTFGTGTYGRIPNTTEWTPETSTGTVTPDPGGFCQSGRCAQWFGGIKATKRAGWQWNQNGGDYDQWDTWHLP
jgi:hypothetical protein